MNPFDGGVVVQFHMSDPATFFETLAVIPEDENVDCAVLQMPPNIFGSGFSTQDKVNEKEPLIVQKFIERLKKMAETGKPIAIWLNSLDSREEKLMATNAFRNLAVFRSADRAVKCLAAMAHYNRRKSCAKL